MIIFLLTIFYLVGTTIEDKVFSPWIVSFRLVGQSLFSSRDRNGAHSARNGTLFDHFNTFPIFICRILKKCLIYIKSLRKYLPNSFRLSSLGADEVVLDWIILQMRCDKLINKFNHHVIHEKSLAWIYCLV